MIYKYLLENDDTIDGDVNADELDELRDCGFVYKAIIITTEELGGMFYEISEIDMTKVIEIELL